MDENILKFRVGIFVVIAMCILGILIFLNSEGWVKQYSVYIKPTSAPGVKTGTPIRKYGVLIGRVLSVKPEDGYVLLDLGINDKERIYENETVSIGSESLLGDAGIEILPLDKEFRGPAVTADHVMAKVAIKRDPMKMLVDMGPRLDNTLAIVQDAGKAIEEAGIGVRDLTATIQSAFKDDESELKALLKNFSDMSINANAALENFNRTFDNVSNVIGDPEVQSRIKQAVADLPRMFKEISDTVTEARVTINKFGTIPEGVNATVENMQVLTKELKEKAPEVLAQVNSSLKDADELMAQIKQFAKTLNKIDFNDGTVGKLLNDTEIYDTVLETVRNIEETSTKFEPLVNDLRLFADAIARNPGAIVKGAIGRGGDKKYKGSAGRDGGLLR